MRFILLMMPRSRAAGSGAMPDSKAVEAMMKYNESLQEAGVLLTLDGLLPPSQGARVSFAGGRPSVVHGPFAEAKEVVAGYWILEVDSMEEAIEWASRCPGSGDDQIEIRQVQEFLDFPADICAAASEFIEQCSRRALSS